MTEKYPITDRNRARAYEIVAGTQLNHPDPHDDSSRIIGWRVPYSDLIGIGQALLGLDYIRASLRVADHARAMSEALLKVRPLGGSEMFSKVGEEYFADPVKCGDEIDRLRAELHVARKEIAAQQKAARHILPYLVYTIGNESPGHHPTMPSAVAAFRQSFGLTDT